MNGISRRLLAVSVCVLAATVPAVAQQAQVNLDWNPQKNTQNLVPYGANVVSPEVRDDGTVTFRVRAPRALEVQLSAPTIAAATGAGTGPQAFTKGADGVWTLTIGPIPANMYVYRFLIDGVSVADPNNTLTGFADQPAYSQLVVHGTGPAYYDARNVPHGNVTRHVYHSAALEGEREMYVYTPRRNRSGPLLSGPVRWLWVNANTSPVCLCVCTW